MARKKPKKRENTRRSLRRRALAEEESRFVGLGAYLLNPEADAAQGHPEAKGSVLRVVDRFLTKGIGLLRRAGAGKGIAAGGKAVGEDRQSLPSFHWAYVIRESPEADRPDIRVLRWHLLRLDAGAGALSEYLPPLVMDGLPPSTDLDREISKRCRLFPGGGGSADADPDRMRNWLPALGREGRLFYLVEHVPGGRRVVPLTPAVAPDPEIPRISVERAGAKQRYFVRPVVADGRTLDVTSLRTAFGCGFGVRGAELVDFGCCVSPALLELITRCAGKRRLSLDDLDRLLAGLTPAEFKENLVLGSGVELREEKVEPVPLLRLSRHGVWPPQQRFRAEVLFRYGETEVARDFEGSHVSLALAEGLRVPRGRNAEARFLAVLDGARCIAPDSFGKGEMALTAKLLPALPALVAAGWQIESLGQPVRTESRICCRITSTADWFDLRAVARFDRFEVAVPELLKRIRSGESMLQLPDGSFALIPAAAVARFGALAALAQPAKSGALRFPRSQGVLLDAALSMQEVELDADAAFGKVRAALEGEAGIRGIGAPAGFHGKLRPYQNDGLAWLQYLRETGFGGCLADDMGLGKTVQVLALLERARTESSGHRASLVVAPRSVLVNWQREAERFVPELRTVIYHGAAREFTEELAGGADLFITTYGTIRNDALQLSEYRFDYCILDEAQAVKNPDAQVSKAVRLIRADHRLVLTGTPIENHLGDLWSLFEFLNPGMLGSGTRFAALLANPQAAPDSPTLRLVARAVQPLILRRTKEAVIEDLPEKTEITLYCELEGEQKQEYRERLAYARAEVLGAVKTQGLNRSKMKVAEMLLRLRQCACHAGLVNPELAGAPSAKLEILLEQLEEITEEGHKALVFSQFTSFLAYARQMLDEKGMTYLYLDGRTRKRQERVDRFQNDPDCRVFLISLKAGGLGLNLTAADYVYILDPWWNPAAEMQAVDRAHRIGQTRKVFAYRVIAKDTVEEKVLRLQQRKRDLAEAILGADKSMLRKLAVEDLELLLS